MLRGPMLTVPLTTGRPVSPPYPRSADPVLYNADDSVGLERAFRGRTSHEVRPLAAWMGRVFRMIYVRLS